MADLDRLLGPDVSEAAAEAALFPDFASIERRGRQRRRTRSFLKAAAVVAVLLGVAGSIRILGADEPKAPGPVDQGEAPRTLAEAGEIQPGTYLIPRSVLSAVAYSVTFPDGWRVWDGNQFGKHPDQFDEVGVLPFGVVDQIYANACLGERGLETRVGPAVDDLVTALLTQPGLATSQPVQTMLGGYPATRVDLRVPRRLQSKHCFEGPGTGLQVWFSEPDNYLYVDPEGVVSVYVVDVNGKRAVFTTQYIPGSTSEQDLAELQEIIDSIDIRE
jgi:hypothetical protein